MRKGLVKKFWIFMVSLLMIIGNMQSFVFAEGDEHNKPLNGNTHSLDVSIFVDGREIQPGGATPVDVDFANTVRVNINWSFLDNVYPYTTADILTYELPEGISANFTGDLMDGPTKEGTFTVSGRKVTIQYTSESFLTESTRKGSLTFDGTFTDKVLHGGEGGQTNLEFPGVGTITIDMHRDTSKDSISVKKSGGDVHKESDGNLYADYLVEIASKGENTNVIFSDKMGEYLTLTGNVQFYTDSDCTSAYTGTVTRITDPDKSFAYRISTMTNGETIYAKYTALVNKAITYNFNDGNKKFNAAFVKSDEHTNENQFWVDAKISEDLKYPTITKDGRKESDGLITWTIQFGKEGFDISGMKLKDILKDVNDGQYLASTFKEGTFKVSSPVEGLDYGALTSDAGFIMPEGSIGVYTITYQTTYTEPVDKTQEFKVNNKVSEYPDGSTEYSSANKDVVVGKKDTYITKECLTTTNSRKIQWKITVTVPESGMENLKVEDTIPDGMTYLDDSVELLSAGYTNPAVSKEGNKITFAFGAVTKGEISFTYKTDITTLPDSETTYTNVAKVYDREKKYGEDDATYKYVFKQYLSKDTDWNTFKVEGNDVSTSIPWVLTVSKLPEDAKNVVITDTLPSNLKMIDNSLMIKENWSKDIASSNINVEITKTSTGNVINFKLSDSLINLAKSNDIQILFNTTYEDLSKVPSGSIEYKNTAQIKVDDYTAPAVSASRRKEYNFKDILNKDGIYNDGETFIHYTISVNKSSADLNPNEDTLTLEDTIGSEIDFQLGTLKINGASATADQYSYDDATRKITITIPDNQYTKITYDGYPNIAVGEKFTGESNNHVVLKGTQKEITADKSFANVEVHQSAGTSSSNGVTLSIYKQERGVAAKPLQGAKFKLYIATCDASGREISAEEIQKTKTTAADGYTRFTGLNRSVIYKLVETKAPDHYELDTTPIYVLFKSETDTTEPIRTVISGRKEYPVDILEGNTSTYQKIVENKPVSESGSITVTKNVEGLATGTNGPEKIDFTVTGPHDYRKVVTVKLVDGTYETVELTGLEPGEYTVTENPEGTEVTGYTLTSTTYKVGDNAVEKATVSKDQTTAVTVTNTYSKDVGNLTITKEVSGLATGTNGPEKIDFTVTGPHDYRKVVTVKLVDGTYETVELTGLEPGEYTVTENPEGTEVTGYTLTSTTYKVGDNAVEKATVSKDQTTAVTVTNTYSKDVGNLTITKEVSGLATGTNGPEKIDFTVTGPHDYRKVVTVKLVDGTYETVELTGLEPGEYTVTENPEGTEVTGYTLTSTTYKVGDNAVEKATVSKDQTTAVTVTNTYSKDVGNLTITKEVSGLATGTNGPEKIDFTVTGPHDYRKVVTVKLVDGTYETVELTGLEPGEYTVTENPEGTEVTGYTLTSTTYKVGDNAVEKATVSKDQTTAVTVTNTYSKDVGNLTITKEVSGLATGTNGPEKIDFTVTGPHDYRKVVTVKLVDGTYETVELTGLEPGEYTVTENPEGTEVTGYTLTSTTYKVGDNAVEKATVSKDQTTAVTVTNTYSKDVGNLTITKEVSGLATGTNGPEKIDFTVTGPHDYRKVVTVKLVDGTYETVELTGLEPGEYTVTENPEGTEVTGYTLTSTTYKVGDNAVEKATVSKDQTTAVTVTNTYSKDVGNLTITKEVSGLATGTNGPEKIDFTVTGPHDYRKVVTVKLVDGTYETVELTGLEPGEYTVTENPEGTEVTGYTLTSTTYKVGDNAVEKATVSKDQTTAVTVTNTYSKDVGNLTITKEVSGLATGTNGPEKIDFTVTGPHDYRKVVTVKLVDGTYETVELTGLEPGEYTVTENPEGTEVTGYTLTSTTYKVGDNAVEKATVSKDQTTAVTVTNTYSKDVGNLTITKEVSGLATGTNGPEKIDFTVTGPHDYRKVVTVKLVDGTYETVELTGLEPGEYTVTENPEGTEVTGYTLTSTTYKVGDNAVEKATVSKDQTTAVTVTNTYSKDVGNLTITKEVSGLATGTNGPEKIDFTVTGPHDYRKVVTVKLVDGTYETVELTGLEPGEYTVTENPEGTEVTGYTLTSTTYKVGDNAVEKATVSKDQTTAVTVTNNYIQLVSYTVKKEWNLNGTEGVVVPETIKVQLTANGIDYGDQVELHASENWTYTWDNLPKSDAAGEINYSVKEIEAPEGYTVSAVPGTESRVITLTNTYTNGKEVTFSKEDVAGNELPGATMSISVKNGEEVSRWVSTSEKNVVTLAPGNYTLTELTAPDGYLKAQSIDFTLDAEGKVSVDGNPVSEVVMVDEYASHDVVISKVDAANNKELAGAVLKVTDKEGNEVDKWTSEEGKNHTVTVKPGTYTFTEVSAPKGYELAESITFNVDLNGKVTIDGKEVTAVVMKDAKKPTNVQTGVHTNVGGFGALGGFSIGMAFIVLFLRKKMD